MISPAALRELVRARHSLELRGVRATKRIEPERTGSMTSLASALIAANWLVAVTVFFLWQRASQVASEKLVHASPWPNQ
jgi:hypothetical protein